VEQWTNGTIEPLWRGNAPLRSNVLLLDCHRMKCVCSHAVFLLWLLSPRVLLACDVPSQLLAGRTLSETRKVLRGEVVFVADARLHDFDTVKDEVEVCFRVLVGEAE